MGLRVDAMGQTDWPQVLAIYLEGISTGHATFQTAAPTWEQWDGGHLRQCRLVARIADEVAGWAALSTVSSRPVYAGVAEVSIYVAASSRGVGVGRSLLWALIQASEQQGIWTLQAGIFPENEASIRLHLGCGFRRVGIRERLGQLKGVWRDVALLERRSPLIT